MGKIEMRWLLCLLATLPAFAISSDPASTAMVTRHACLVLPGSMNGGKHPRGCPGAVWRSGSPAASRCSGGGGKYPWWKDCCQWRGGSCKPKPTVATSCWDGISLDQFEASCEWVIKKDGFAANTWNGGFKTTDAKVCAQKQFEYAQSIDRLQAPGRCSRCYDPTYENWLVVRETSGGWPFHMPGYQMAMLCTECEYPNALKVKSYAPYSGQCISFESFHGGVGGIGTSQTHNIKLIPKFVTKLGSVMTGNGITFPEVGAVRALCWAYKQVGCTENQKCTVEKKTKCMSACVSTYAAIPPTAARNFHAAADCQSAGGHRAANVTELRKFFHPLAAQSKYDTMKRNPIVQKDEEAKLDRWLGPGNTGSWCCFEDCDQIHNLAASKAYLATHAAKSAFGNMKWNQKICHETILGL